VDTDQIIPAEYLKRIGRTGYGQFLFQAWRTTASGKPNPQFVLNDARYDGATILATGANFGCGSSREHAAWALLDYGFRTIIAPSFGDTFRNNCYQNGILLVTFPGPVVQRIMDCAEHDNEYRITVDLATCSVRDTNGMKEDFTIDPFRKQRLLDGLDDIDITLQQQSEIEAYEIAHGIIPATRAAEGP
jgi:3-isopropylmalate/(R)-2-methylmalate dehydratase small subunit